MRLIRRSNATRRLALVMALALAACGGSGGGGGFVASTVAPATSSSTSPATTAGSVAVPPGSTRPGAGAPVLVAARFHDGDGSGGATAGDEVTLVFDRVVQVQSADARAT